MADKPVVPTVREIIDEFKLKSEDDPRVLAERYLNWSIRAVDRLTRELRQAKIDERRARSELAILDVKGREGAPDGHRP